MAINVKELAKLGWSKRWAGQFSILTASYWGKQIIINLAKVHLNISLNPLRKYYVGIRLI